MRFHLSAFLLLVGIAAQLGSQTLAQTVQASNEPDTVVMDRVLVASDSLNCLLDSLEIQLLWTTQSYRQVERLLQHLPSESTYLAWIPSVLPVNLPLDAFLVTSPFGPRRHPIRGQLRFHGGVDVRARLGTIVKATAPGVVQRVGYDAELGVFVQIKHPFGFETTYGHLAGYCVEVGQPVDRNQEIGRVGRTGLVTGPHLHYVIKKNGSAVDPFAFCFLLRRRLWLRQRMPSGSSVVPVDSGNRSASER